MVRQTTQLLHYVQAKTDNWNCKFGRNALRTVYVLQKSLFAFLFAFLFSFDTKRHHVSLNLETLFHDLVCDE